MSVLAEVLLPLTAAAPLPEPLMRVLGAGAAGAALAGIAWIDLRRWEIDPWLCGLAVLAGALLAELDGTWADALTGAVLGQGAALLIRAWRPGAAGLGDVQLYALCGFLVGGSGFIAWALCNSAASLACTACLAVRRGRKLGRCAIPAAVPACPTAAAVMLM